MDRLKDKLEERIHEYLDHRVNGNWYAHDFKCKLSLDIEYDEPQYIMLGSIDDVYKNITPERKFEIAFNIETRLESVFYHLRLGDWKTAYVHLNQLKPDEYLSQGLINDINKDIIKYIKQYYSNNIIEDLSKYNFNKVHNNIIIKRKSDNI